MFKLFLSFLNEAGRPYRRRIFILFILSIITGLLEIAGIALVFPLIALVNDISIVEKNEYLGFVYRLLGFTDPKTMVYLVALLIGGVFVFKNLYMILYQYMQLSLVKVWRDAICSRIMQKYLSAPYKYHLKRSSSEMINTLDFTVYFVLDSFVFSTVMMVANAVVAIMLLGFIMAKYFVASLVSGGVLGLMMLVQARLIRTSSEKISQRMIAARDKNLSVLTQAIAAIKETKSFVREAFFLDTYRLTNREISHQDKVSIFIKYIPAYVNEIAMVVTVIVMSCLVLAEAYTPVGGVASLAILAAVAFRMAPMVNRTLYAYSQMRFSSQATITLLDEMRMLESLESDALAPDAAPLPFQYSLALKDVSFRYDTQIVLDSVSINVQKGEFIGIVGSSGAGKTTLVDILLGLHKPEAGSFTVDGIEITASNLVSLRKITGYVSQSPYVFDGTVRENVAFGLPEDQIDDARVANALQMACIDEFFRSKEDYLRQRIGEGGKSLSGGQKQRLAIARALYNDPEIIILDEATSALDVETEHEITGIIQSLRGRKTIIAIAHRLSTLKGCDRVIYMDKGRVVDCGTFAELEKRHEGFTRLVELSSIKRS